MIHAVGVFDDLQLAKAEAQSRLPLRDIAVQIAYAVVSPVVVPGQGTAACRGMIYLGGSQAAEGLAAPRSSG